MEKQKSIGIFDSGVGGLSIGLAIKKILPYENIDYFADFACSPYGNKSQSFINQRSENIVNFLIKQNCKIVVLACNTATVNSISNLRSKISVPLIGVEPAIKPAALNSKTGVIGVLATQQTIESTSFKLLKSQYENKVKILSKACPDFVTLVENLNHNRQQSYDVAEQYLRPLLNQECDQIVLGCTHFSFLSSVINQVAGNKVNIIDTAIPVAMQVKRILIDNNLENLGNDTVTRNFWASETSPIFAKAIEELWGENIRINLVETISN